MDKLIQALKIAFASEFNFYLKTHAYHWNVQGAEFSQYHELFGNIYEEVYGSIDVFAENIRKLDALVEVDSINQRSLIQLPQDNLLDIPAMVQVLLGDNDKMVKLFAMLSTPSAGPLANSPNEVVADIEAVTTDAGGGVNGPKHVDDIRVKDPRGFE